MTAALRSALVLISPLLAACLLACSPQSTPSPAPAPPLPAEPTAEASAEAPHRAHWEVDGKRFELESEEATGARIPAIGREGVEHVVIELRSADQVTAIKLELFLASAADIEGEFTLVPLQGPTLNADPGQARLLLAYSTEAGRVTLPSGQGRVRIEQQDDALVASFSFSGDGRFRPTDADPVVGELRIRRSLTRL